MTRSTSATAIDAGYQDFADRWNPILDVFDAEGVCFAHEVHPGEIAYDYHTSLRALEVEAIDHRRAFGLNWDPSHMMWQHIDPVAFITDTVDWFPHLSPDGRLAVYLQYPAGTEGHPENLPVELVLVDVSNWSAPLARVPLFGGQGTINVNSWSPDSTRFAFVSYPVAAATDA
jgi:Xylose isomerase-like TIM barrel